MPAYGSGTVYRRGGGWWVQFWHAGRCYRESAKTGSKDEAKRYLKRRLGEMASGKLAGGLHVERVTVRTLIEMVYAHYILHGRRSIYEVRTRLEAHLLPALGSRRVATVTSHDLLAYIARRRAAGVSNATVNRELALLRLGLNLGRRADPPLVVRSLTVPKLPEGNVRQGFLEQGRYVRLRDELPEHLRGLYSVAYHVGCRRGELLDIRCDQVDLGAGIVRLDETQTKGKVARVLPIYGEMWEWLDRALATRDPRCRWLFQHEGKRILDFTRAWNSACERAGVPGLLFHDLRRSAIRNMERAGIPRSVAMAISGHKTESVYRRYAIVSESDLRDAGAKLERFMKAGGSGG